MKLTRKEKIIKSSLKNPKVLGSDKYIDAQLNANWLLDLVIQMGPNCNRECFHCYGDYGPHRRGLPQIEIVRKSLEEATEAGFIYVTLTDGESFRHENKKVIEEVAKHSKEFSTRIITNGVFANNLKNTRLWFNLLKENGFDLGYRKNLLQVSSGLMYKVHWHNYIRINGVIKETFPDADLGKHFYYTLLMLGNKKERDIEVNLLKGLYYIFGDERTKEIQIKFKEGKTMERAKTLFYPKKGTPIEIIHDECDPDGRAKNLSIWDEKFPIKTFDLKNINFFPDIDGSMWVSQKGEVGFGTSGACVRNGRIYGDIKKDSLLTIKKRIYNDGVYQAFRLGGVKFLYYLSKQIDPNFNVNGRIKCDVCHNFFENVDLVEAVRRNLDGEVIKVYKDYISRLD